jgi:hypothetical protein
LILRRDSLRRFQNQNKFPHSQSANTPLRYQPPVACASASTLSTSQLRQYKG